MDASAERPAELSIDGLSWNLLELLLVRTKADVTHASMRSREAASNWDGVAQPAIDFIQWVVEQACTNVVEHSGTDGVLAIQKYNRGEAIEIQLAVGDLGIGIRSSLLSAGGESAVTPGKCILEVLNGTSVRSRRDRSSRGLASIAGIAFAHGGSVHLRSDTGLVRASRTEGYRVLDGLTYVPGTQMSLRVQLPIS